MKIVLCISVLMALFGAIRTMVSLIMLLFKDTIQPLLWTPIIIWLVGWLISAVVGLFISSSFIQ